MSNVNRSISCNDTLRLLVEFSLTGLTEIVPEQWFNLKTHMKSCKVCNLLLPLTAKKDGESAAEEASVVHEELGRRLSRLSSNYLEPSDSDNGQADTKGPGAGCLMTQITRAHKLSGKSGEYQIVRRLGRGTQGQTYLAFNQDESGNRNLFCIKFPLTELFKKLNEGISKWITVVQDSFLTEYGSMQRLRKLECITKVLDYGTLEIEMAGITYPMHFIVQEFVEGDNIGVYVKNKYGNEGVFSGIPDIAEWFSLGRRVAQCMSQIHERQVVHGDICPRNVFVTPDGHIKLTDFGQAIFPDVGFGETIEQGPDHFFAAPERKKFGSKWGAGADIYSLGGLLLYLATGQYPPENEYIEDDLKEKVTAMMKATNRTLYDANSGVADIIARCIREDQIHRTPNIEMVLNDLETFCPSEREATIQDDLEVISAGVSELERSGSTVFNNIAQQRIRTLAYEIKKMEGGLYDLAGNHELIASALSRYISVLQSGDQYLAITIPSFWAPQNLGVNGRFVTMHKLAALRGVCIKRVLLLTEDELQEGALGDQVIRVHKLLAQELSSMGVTVDNKDINGPGFYTGVKVVGRGERLMLLKQGLHMGVWRKDNESMSIMPSYQQRDSGTMVSITLRRNPGELLEFMTNLKEFLQESLPIQADRLSGHPDYVFDGLVSKN